MRRLRTPLTRPLSAAVINSATGKGLIKGADHVANSGKTKSAWALLGLALIVSPATTITYLLTGGEDGE